MDGDEDLKKMKTEKWRAEKFLPLALSIFLPFIFLSVAFVYAVLRLNLK
ncbi:hypothetical protein HUU05_17520 [candidate division KSB1 bacterium]|nr:hypothetical protein [candidate division KSB1 bacterium]